MNQFPKMAVPGPERTGGCYCGRRGLPREWVLQMYEDYKRLGSIAKVAALYDRTRQNMWGIFQTAGLQCNPKHFLKPIVHKGVKYTLQYVGRKHRYYRATVGRGKGREKYLHHVIWEEHAGRIPDGYKVCFRDGNSKNCDITNLELLSNSEQPRKHATGANQYTITAKARLERLMTGGVASAQLKARAA